MYMYQDMWVDKLEVIILLSTVDGNKEDELGTLRTAY